MSACLLIVNAYGRIISSTTVRDDMVDTYVPAKPQHKVYRTTHEHAHELFIQGIKDLPADDGLITLVKDGMA